jgi:hypothetical protein
MNFWKAAVLSFHFGMNCWYSTFRDLLSRRLAHYQHFLGFYLSVKPHVGSASHNVLPMKPLIPGWPGYWPLFLLFVSSPSGRYLMELVERHGQQRWSLIATYLTGRIGKQCRERWHNHLRPDIKVLQIILLSYNSPCRARQSLLLSERSGPSYIHRF